MKIDRRMALSIICRLPSEFVDMIADEEGEDMGENWKLTMRVLGKFRRKFLSQKEELEKSFSKKDMEEAFSKGKDLEKFNILEDLDEDGGTIEHSGFNGWLDYYLKNRK
jgi:hypothetical protein